MPIRVLLVVALLGVSGNAWADVVPQRKWLQVRSPHFTVMGEVSAPDLRRVAERMEQLHALIGMLTNTRGADTSDVTVIVFRGRRAFQPFQPLQRGERIDVAGYFLPGPMNYIAVLADSRANDSSIVYHEYIHLAAERALGSLPIWMHEGLAEFYSTFELIDDGRSARLGSVPIHHVERLQRELLPLTTLASIDHDSPYYQQKNRRSLFYAESWALIHFLQIGKDRKYAARLPAFVEALLGGDSFERACVQRLGTTPKALEAELQQYLGNPVFHRYDVELPAVLEHLERLEATRVEEGEAHAILAQLLLFQNRSEEARAYLDHALAADARQPLALARQAELAAAAHQPDEAVALARRAGEPAHATYISQYYRAAALEEAISQPAVGPAAVIAAWQQVVALNPTFAEGHARLAQARADARSGLDEARQSQERAVALAPTKQEYRLGLARILIMLRDTGTARRMLGPMMARGSTPAIKVGARRYLAAAAAVELTGGAGPDALLARRPGQ